MPDVDVMVFTGESTAFQNLVETYINDCTVYGPIQPTALTFTYVLITF